MKARTESGSVYTFTEIGAPVHRESDHEVQRLSGLPQPPVDVVCTLVKPVVIGKQIIMWNPVLECERFSTRVVAIVP